MPVISITQNGREINPTYERKKLKAAAVEKIKTKEKIKKAYLAKRKSSSKRMKAIHSAVGKLLKKQLKYKAMERKTIKLKRTPSYEGGRVALLNSGSSFFKR